MKAIAKLFVLSIILAATFMSLTPSVNAETEVAKSECRSGDGDICICGGGCSATSTGCTCN